MSGLNQAGGNSAAMMAQSAALMNRYRQSATAPNVFSVGRTGHPNEQFPVQLSTTDPEDEKWALRQNIVTGANGVVPGIGQAIAPSEYWDYAARKEQADTLLQFQQFVLQQCDLSTPESANWWYQKFPWIKDLKLSEMRAQADLQKKYAEIQITGPQNEEDFMLIWMRKQGLIKVSDKIPEELYKDETIISKNYKDGMFSPLAKKIPPTTAQIVGGEGNKIPFNNPMGPPVKTSNMSSIAGFPTSNTLSNTWNFKA